MGIKEIDNAKTEYQFKNAIIRRYGERWEDNIKEIIDHMPCPNAYRKGKQKLACIDDNCYTCCKKYLDVTIKKHFRKGNTAW